MTGFEVVVALSGGDEERYPAKDGDDLLTAIEAILESKTWTSLTVHPVASPPQPTTGAAGPHIVIDETSLRHVHWPSGGGRILCDTPVETGSTLVANDPTGVTCPKCAAALAAHHSRRP